MSREYVSGLFGGAAGLVVGHPFDTVKIRLQTQGVAGVELRYHGMLHCFWDISKTESFAGLYKGVLAPAAGITFQNGIVFCVQRTTAALLQPQGGPITFTNSVLAGTTAGFLQSFILSPVELVRLRMQMQGIGKWEVFFEYNGHRCSPGAHEHYNSSWECFTRIWKTEGIRGIYRGLVTTLARDTVGFAIYFGMFDYMCQYQAKRLGITVDEVGPGTLIFAGGISGIFSWIPIYPIDVIKTRIQADGVEGITKYSGAMDCYRKTRHVYGLNTFFKGIVPTLVRAFPTNAATLTTFVMMERCMRRHNVGMSLF